MKCQFYILILQGRDQKGIIILSTHGENLKSSKDFAPGAVGAGAGGRGWGCNFFPCKSSPYDEEQCYLVSVANAFPQSKKQFCRLVCLNSIEY